MSIIQNIRERGTWIILGFIAIALIAFILQDGIGRNKGNGDLAILGEINGQEINKIDFEQKLQYKIQKYAAQGQNVKREQILNNAWEEELYTTLISQESDKIGLAVGNKEIEDILYGDQSPFLNFPNPPNDQQYISKTTDEQGNDKYVINKQGLATYISQLKKSNKKELVDQRDAIEKNEILPAVKNRLINKYINLLIKGVQTPKWLLDKQYAENNAISNINYVYVPFTSIPSANIKVSTDEINAYLKENSAAYQTDELQRNMSFVGFSATPTAPDSLVAKNNILGFKENFKTTTDITAYLNNAGSETQYDSAYYSKSILQLPNIDSILNTNIGGVYGPYIDGKNLTLTKLVGKKQWPDSANVRHILLVTNYKGQIVREDSVAKKLMDSIQTAIKGGASFDDLAKKYSNDGRNKDNGGKLETFTQRMQIVQSNPQSIQYPQALINYVFDNPVGTAGVIKTELGYQYVEILKQSPRNPVYNLAQLSKPIAASKETIAAAQSEATKFAASCKDVASFTANATKLGKQPIPANGIKGYDFQIPGLGEKRDVVKWLFEKEVNQVSEPIEIAENFIVAIITGEDKPGLVSAETAKSMNVEELIKNKKKAEQLKAKLKGASLEAIAAANNTQVQKLDSLGYNNNSIQGVGAEPKLIGAAFNKSLVNKISDPIVGNNGVFALTVNNLGAIAAQLDANTFKYQISGEQANLISGSYRALKKSAKIVDNRTKLF
jgi:peptidyl-prolyl cis-trans isomerase D